MIVTDGVHLLADSLSELHEFAEIIGLKREWFQPKSSPHYDIWGIMKKKAIKAGAKLVSIEIIVEKAHKLREEYKIVCEEKI